MVWPFTKRLTDDEAITLAELHGVVLIRKHGIHSTVAHRMATDFEVPGVTQVWYEVDSCKTEITIPGIEDKFIVRRPVADTVAGACRIHLRHHNITMDGPCADLGRRLKNWWQRALTNFGPAR